jgi:acetolactate synthase-1/2/3 large subunit
LGIFGFEKADVVICVGYDMVECHPEQWNPDENKGIVYIEVSRAEVDEHYILKVGLGRLGRSPTCDSREAKPQAGYSRRPLREVIVNEIAEFAADESFPMKPQRIAWRLRGSHGACGVRRELLT